MPNNFLVFRIRPDSPVDGGTFSTYLDDLQIKVFLSDHVKPCATPGVSYLKRQQVTLCEKNRQTLRKSETLV